ncbi:hypothetical protein KC318_g13771 [Hortaea werneckii]|nr:hypothetical protein KC342_g9068 [Hortaea werneckii]KAI6891448.1 hypothetical protein KC334_g14027 [Hortaea werneckii]KAI6952486.1 hypothetical protein KC355_g13978 [Hortaea werneckii]KAI7103862.1 hypothetical protein KC339_g4940 [Hortaea werneckii]KAI7160327.1 hypothetical protein KC349_g3552 [Hortaea werneckii]
MNSPTRQLLVQTARQYSSRTAGPTRREKLGAAAIMGYCCIAFTSPFAGAAVVSRKAQKDQRYQNMRPLSFRDCLPGSRLEDYAGALRSS